MKISIISINLNDAEGLAKTLASVRSQTYAEIEHLIIDGASTDGSLEVIEDSADSLDFWLSEKDSGMYQAMNKGIAKATGDYLLFLNSGDNLSNNGVIKNAVALFKNEDIIYGNIHAVFKGHIVRTEVYPDTLNFNYFISGALPHQGMFIRSSVFERTGLYDESLKICADWKFQLDAICRYKCSYKHIDLTISDFSGHGISSQPENQQVIRQEKEKLLISEYSLFAEDLQLLKEYKDLAYYYQNSGRVKWLRKFNILKNMLSGRFSKNYKSY